MKLPSQAQHSRALLVAEVLKVAAIAVAVLGTIASAGAFVELARDEDVEGAVAVGWLLGSLLVVAIAASLLAALAYIIDLLAAITDEVYVLLDDEDES